MATLLFYNNPIPLDKKKHNALKLVRQNGYNFTQNTNSVPVAGFEFFECSRHFPIFFIKQSDDSYLPLAILSLRKSGNDLGDTWQDVYVPSYVRRYPFVLSTDGLVLIDSEATHFSEEDGDPLFANEEGEPSETLKEIVQFLETVDRSYKATEEFCKALAEKDMIEPFNRNLKVDNTSLDMRDLYIINERKMHENLSEAEVADWFRKGWIAWAHAQLHSLGAVNQVVKRAHDAGVNPFDEPSAAAN